MSARITGVLRPVWRFYYDGFRSMTVGRKVWLVILIKLFIMFFVLRLFFFQRVAPRFSFEQNPETIHRTVNTLTQD